MGSVIITNPLDEQLKKVLPQWESAQRISHIMATLKVTMTMCSLLSVWSNFFDRLWASFWHCGSSIWWPKHLKRSKRAVYYARDTWCHML
uniref:Uncharacterized protein n=1 Tax=Hyaloperonospora arabidopsidis (strain Emoy2) TaxID=559515 RepID=M4B717_HYAAE